MASVILRTLPSQTLIFVTVLLTIGSTPCQGQGIEFPTDPELTLEGPDMDRNLKCTTPSTYPVDTHVEWYINGNDLKSQLLPQGQDHVYESMEDIIDLLGTYPGTMQCRIVDRAISPTDLVSNMLIIV